MRRILAAGVCGLFLLSALVATGCSSEKGAKSPSKTIGTPKEGPTPAGGGAGAGSKAGTAD